MDANTRHVGVAELGGVTVERANNAVANEERIDSVAPYESQNKSVKGLVKLLANIGEDLGLNPIEILKRRFPGLSKDTALEWIRSCNSSCNAPASTALTEKDREGKRQDAKKFVAVLLVLAGKEGLVMESQLKTASSKSAVASLLPAKDENKVGKENVGGVETKQMSRRDGGEQMMVDEVDERVSPLSPSKTNKPRKASMLDGSNEAANTSAKRQKANPKDEVIELLDDSEKENMSEDSDSDDNEVEYVGVKQEGSNWKR